MTETTPALTKQTKSAPTTNKNKKKSPPFTQIPDRWEALIGYQYRMITRKGFPALDKRGKPKMGSIDLYDLMIIDVIRSYKERGNIECFMEADGLAIKIGMRGQPLAKVCDRVLQLIHLGFIRYRWTLKGANDVPTLILEVDEELLNSVIDARIEERRAAKLLAVKNGDYSTSSMGTLTLKEYIKEYIKQQVTEQLPEYPTEHEQALPEVNECSESDSDCMENDISISPFVYREDIVLNAERSPSTRNNEYLCEDYKAAVREQYPETTINHFPKIPYTAVVDTYADNGGIDVSADDFDDEGTTVLVSVPRYTGRENITTTVCPSQSEVAEAGDANVEPMINGRTISEVHRELQAFLHDLDPVAKLECFMPCVKENGRLLEAYKTAGQGNTLPLENWLKCAEEYTRTH